MRLALTIAATLVLLPTQLRAQRADADSAKNAPLHAHSHGATAAARPTARVSRAAAGQKDPGTATAMGLLFPGAGQLYAGRSGKGLGLLGLSAAAVVGGAAASSTDKCTTTVEGTGNVYSQTCTEGKRGPLYAGVGVAVVSWLYGAFSAAGDARDANEEAHRHARATPMLERTGGRTELGLAYRF